MENNKAKQLKLPEDALVPATVDGALREERPSWAVPRKEKTRATAVSCETWLSRETSLVREL